jgi:hypothetical protein
VAHQLIDHPGGDAGILQPGREGVAQVVRPMQVQAVQGTGHVLVAPTAEDQGTFAVQVEVNIHGATPNTTFAVARAVDLNPDGVCTEASGWLPLGDLTTSPGGAGAAHFEVHRGAPFLSGVRFDAVFRAVSSDGTELRSDCLTVTVK